MDHGGLVAVPVNSVRRSTDLVGWNVVIQFEDCHLDELRRITSCESAFYYALMTDSTLFVFVSPLQNWQHLIEFTFHHYAF